MGGLDPGFRDQNVPGRGHSMKTLGRGRVRSGPFKVK